MTATLNKQVTAYIRLSWRNRVTLITLALCPARVAKLETHHQETIKLFEVSDDPESPAPDVERSIPAVGVLGRLGNWVSQVYWICGFAALAIGFLTLNPRIVLLSALALYLLERIEISDRGGVVGAKFGKENNQ